MAYKVANINDLFRVKSDGAIEFGTSGAGTDTYVLTSAGPNATPTWTEPTTGTVTSIKLNADSGNSGATAITTSGIFTFTGGANITTSVSGKIVTIDADLSGTVTGSGLENRVARWTADGSDIGDGPITFSAATATANSTFGGNVLIPTGKELIIGSQTTAESPLGITIRDNQGDAPVGIVIHNENTGSASDAQIAFETQGALDFSIGLDRSDSSKFVMSRASVLGTNNVFTIDGTTATFTGDITIDKGTGGNAKINLIENSGGTQNAAIEFDQAGENALYISTNYVSPSDSNRILLQPGSYPALTASGGANGSINSKVQILGTLQADRNIQTPNSDLSSTAAPTNFGVYTSEIRLIETPNGGLKQCRVITDNYGEWILVGRFAASAMNSIANGNSWSSESGLDTGTAQNLTTKFSADFGDSYPTEVRIMGATDFTKWRDTRTVDFIYGVPEGRQWKFFFSGGVENGMALSTKYGWGINGAYDGFGRWVNPAQTFVRMSDGNVTNPSAAYTTATTNAFNWDSADDAKITVSATRVFSGQDTFLTSGFGNDDNIYGFFDEYPNEVTNMQGGVDFSSAAWVLIKLPNASSGGGGGGDTFWSESNADIYNTNSGNVAIGATDPGNVRLFVENPSGSTDPVFETRLDTTYKMGISNRWVSTTVSKLKIGRSGTAAEETSSIDFIYDIAGAEYGSIKRNFVQASLKFERATSTDMIIDGSGNVGIGKTTSLTSHRLSVLKGASNQQLGLFYDETNFAAIGAKSNGDVQIYGYGGGALANILLAVDGSAVGANVGIATTSPTVRLDISGSSGGASVRIKDNMGAGAYYYGYMYDGGNLQGTTQTNIFYAGGSVAANTTITDYASIRIDTPSVAATNATITNNYGIYQGSNLQRNTFVGSVSVGTNSNASTFVVQGNSYFKKDHGDTWVADFHNISADYQGVRIRQDSTSGSGGPGSSGNSALVVDDQRANNMVTPTPTVYIKRSGANTNGLLLSVEPHAVTGLTVNDAGRVGVGTEAPDAQLEVETASYANSNAVANFINGNNPTRVAYDTVVVAQTDVASLSIVETPAGGQSVEQKLTLAVGDDNAVIRSTSTATNGMYILVGASTTAPAYQTTSGLLGIRILNSGFVGVGANVPRSKLEIYRAAGSSGTPQLIISTGEGSSRDYSLGTDVMAAGDFAILDGVTSTVANVRMRFVDGGTVIAFRDNNTTELGRYINTPTGGAIKRIRMSQGGEIHFGDTVGSSPLGITEGTWDQFSDEDLMSIYARHRLNIYAYPGGTTISASFVSGTFTAVGDVVAYGSPSDKRLKENIKPIESALEKVSKLQGVTFDWKKSDSILDIKEDIGFIAQDVQKVIPELVRENEDGMLSMRHQGIAPILLEAIKELKAEIDLLKSKPCTCNKCNCNI